MEEQYVDEKTRWVEIYKITNNVTNKIYIGQAISHIRKRNKFIKHGTNGRFKTHLQEVYGNNNSKYGCKLLNNSIKKHGVENFTFELIQKCNEEDANKIESENIIKYNSLTPNGYNLTTSCRAFCPSYEFRKNVSSGIIDILKDKRLKRISMYKLAITDDIEKYVTPKYRIGVQSGWRIRLKDIVLDQKIRPNEELEFTSTLTSLEENKLRAIEFLKMAKECLNSDTSKLRETTLEPI